jgi:peptidoglycan/xylan/chitin deacetylase (PgdA/CDA1 family)
LIGAVRRAATALLGRRRVNDAVRALARARGHRLVLVYHRVGDPVRPGYELIPSVTLDIFRAQIQALADLVDLVSLDDLLANSAWASRTRRPAVSVTFDDDLPSHVSHALPVLRECGVSAAFFLSGRALHGLGPYWFQQLEALLVAHGGVRTAALLGRTAVDSADGWVRQCESDPTLARGISGLAADLPDPAILTGADIAALAEAGMTIGFHTRNHQVLPGLDDDALTDAVRSGRDELAAAAGTRVRYFAYPYGQADARSASAVAAAGFDAAFTGRPEPLRRRSNRFHLGRWEPGPLGVDDLLVKLAVRFHRAAPGPAQRLP